MTEEEPNRRTKSIRLNPDLYDKVVMMAYSKFGRASRLPSAITLGFEEAMHHWIDQPFVGNYPLLDGQTIAKGIVVDVQLYDDFAAKARRKYTGSRSSHYITKGFHDALQSWLKEKAWEKKRRPSSP